MSMTNEERDQLIQRYYDGETLGNENALAERLLDDDPEARSLLESLRTISGAIRTEVDAAVAQEDFSSFWDDVAVRLPKGPLTLETGQDSAREAQRLAAEENLLAAGAPEPITATGWAWLRGLLSGPGLAVAGAALCVVALVGPMWSGGDGSLPVAGMDQTIEVESIDSPGAFVMVVQESSEVPAIVWVTETEEG
ncbi:MAG: hypothetical protein KDA24_24855 [Deltaproteobacteria bacterium]|nr:hypothetical protein [Deltaproteobacteria bacterium]